MTAPHSSRYGTTGPVGQVWTDAQHSRHRIDSRASIHDQMCGQPGRAGPGQARPGHDPLFLKQPHAVSPAGQEGPSMASPPGLLEEKGVEENASRLIYYCTADRVCASGNDQSYLAAQRAQAVDRRTSVSNGLWDRRMPCTIMGPITLWASILEPPDGRVKFNRGDLGELRRSYVRLFTATATLHLRCNADSIVLCPCTPPLPQDSIRYLHLQLFLI